MGDRMADEKDVKVAQETSTEKDVKEVKDSSSDEVFEGEERSIPYARFKEKVSEARELKRMIDKLNAEKDSAIRETAQKYQTYYESEISKMQRAKEESSYDYDLDAKPEIDTKLNPLLDEIRTLKREISEIKSKGETEGLVSQIQKLKSVYPELDDEHVLVVKKTKPDWSIEECAEYSHKYFEDRVKGKFNRMMEKKKEAAKKPIIGADGKLNIPSGEKPKSFADARKRMIEYAEQLDRR
jgi:hypothetical protein